MNIRSGLFLALILAFFATCHVVAAVKLAEFSNSDASAAEIRFLGD